MLFSLARKVFLTGKVVNLWRFYTAKHCDYTDIEEIQSALQFIWKGSEWQNAEANFWAWVRDLEQHQRKHI